MKDSKLVLFVPRDRQHELQQDLDKLLASQTEIFQNDYRIHIIEKDIVVTDEDAPAKYASGSKIYYHRSDRSLHQATCGTFLTDERNRMYILFYFIFLFFFIYSTSLWIYSVLPVVSKRL